MNRNIGRLFVFFVFAALILSTVSANAATCSLASVHGTYAGERVGTIVKKMPGYPPPPAPYDEVLILTADGAGSFYGKAAVNIGGLSFQDFSFAGTYTVNSDCTGTLTVDVGGGLVLHEWMVVIDGGKRLVSTETDDFAVVHLTAQKLGD